MAKNNNWCAILGHNAKKSGAFKFAVTYHKKFNPVAFSLHVCKRCDAIIEKPFIYKPLC